MIRFRRAALSAVTLAVGFAVFGVAAPASAHVSVNPNEATQGGYGRFAFRVPNESDTASTVKVEVVLPENAPVGSVSTMPVAGWTVAVEKRTLDTPVEVHGTPVTEVPSKITWTADGEENAIKAGQFQEFPVSLGPLPQVETMVFKSLQTYSDGTVVRWIEEPVAGGEEPAHPAPVLTLAAGGSAGHGAEARNDDDDDESEGSSAALALGIAGLVAGLGGLALGGAAFARTRRA
ncbi:YcnI family protein [Micromonosporaceae bacterium DT194]|uniref:YcnI family copper-binding membrane protein n=1 Tax=Melissospora conviva TaxID=3388432 RepID=UPI003C292845